MKDNKMKIKEYERTVNEEFSKLAKRELTLEESNEMFDRVIKLMKTLKESEELIPNEFE